MWLDFERNGPDTCDLMRMYKCIWRLLSTNEIRESILMYRQYISLERAVCDCDDCVYRKGGSKQKKRKKKSFTPAPNVHGT